MLQTIYTTSLLWLMIIKQWLKDTNTMSGASGAESFTLDYNKNGNMTDGVSVDFVYNWDKKLRSAAIGSDSIALKYGPMGNRIWKEYDDGQNTTRRKYIVDIVGELPTTLLEMAPDNQNNIEKTYIYDTPETGCVSF